jgi:MarR family transcriptional regulator, temperature-dependent positive regulator of motility
MTDSQKRKSKATPDIAVDAVSMDLYEQPGHLLRRAHQISLGIFTELVSSEITPIQYGILRMVHEVPGIDQVGLARRVAVDTSTAAQTAARLESKGLLRRLPAETDRRQLTLYLTPEGERLLVKLVSGVHRMRERLLGSLEVDEQALFMSLLRKFVHLNNDQSRAPLREPAERNLQHAVARGSTAGTTKPARPRTSKRP